MTQDISTPVSLVTLIQQLHEYVGRNCRGRATLSMTSTLPNSHITVTTHIDLCAKSSGMDRTTVANPQPSPSNPDSPSTSSSPSSPSTLTLFLHTRSGKAMSIPLSEEQASYLVSQGVSAGSWEDGTILISYVKRLPMTPRVP